MDKKCIIHQDRDAISFCHSCKNYFCKECLKEGPTFYYCYSEDCQAELKIELDNQKNNIIDKKKRWKYGWGWVVLVWSYLINSSITKYYPEANTIFIARILSIIISLSFYFLFRQKFLTKIKSVSLRSILSGIVAIILTIPFIRLIEYLLF